MKTSLEIDDRLYKAARLRAVRERTTVRALIERGLEVVLGLGPAPRAADPGEARALKELCSQVSALPVLTSDSAEQILGYDESGALS